MAAVKYWFRNVIEGIRDTARRVAAGLLLGWVSLAIPAAAEPPGDRDALTVRLAGLAVYAAEFTQSVYGARGELLEQSEGYVRLQRPDFKWVVQDPYPQIIVTEGDRLKLYDPDLEQLTIRPLDEALQDTPVSLLTRDDVMLGEQFTVVQIADAEGESYLIEPRSEETLYRQIQLHFSAGPVGVLQFIGLDILDHLGQRTEIRFDPDPGITHIAAGEFALEVPADTDVVGG
jgi:outer membrane lipoprotein carrier protein